MSPEWVTALASLATFIVVGGSAIAALIQLRHLRNSNQLVVLNEMRHSIEAPAFSEAFQFVTTDLPQMYADPGKRALILSRESKEWQMAKTVGNFLDQAGALVKHGMVNRDLACDLWYTIVTRSWDALAPVTASQRARLGIRLWEDFEYVTLLCRRFRARYPNGTYPLGEDAVPLPDPWPEAVVKQKNAP